MKNVIRPPVCALFAAAILALLLQEPLYGQDTWNGTAGDLLWSTSGNWDGGVPDAFAAALFDLNGATNTSNLINNIVDGGFTSTIAGLGYSSPSTNGFHTTLIPPGQTLTIVPQSSGQASLAVGTWAGTGIISGQTASNDINIQVVATIVGTNGTLRINDPSGTSSIRVGQGSAQTGTHFSTLDMSRLSTFTATVSNVLIGADLYIYRNFGNLILAQTNTITTVANPFPTNFPGIILGCGGYVGGFDNLANAGDGGSGTMTLGQVNVFNTDWLVVGGHRANQANNTLLFGAGVTNGSFKLRGSGGGRAPLITIGDELANDASGPDLYLQLTSRSTTGIADFRGNGNSADILVDNLTIGRNATTNETGPFNTGATGTGTGTLSFDNGIVDVNNLYIGAKTYTNYSGATGTMNVGGSTNGGTATLKVDNNIIMAFRSTNVGTTATATLNVNSNGIVNVQSSIIRAPTNFPVGSATITINAGGTLNMQSAGSVTVDTLTVNNPGSLLHSSNVNVSGTATLTGNPASLFTNLAAGTLTLNSNTLTVLNPLAVGALNLNANAAIINTTNITVTNTLTFNNTYISNGLTLIAGTLTLPAGPVSGTIANFANVTNTSSLFPGTSDSAGTLGIGGNLTLSSNVSMTFALSSVTTIGNGINSYVNISSNLTLLNSNRVVLEVLAPLSANPYRLVDYAGALSVPNGGPFFTNNTRYSLGLDLSTPGQINLTNSGTTTPSNLVWLSVAKSGSNQWNVLSVTNFNANTQRFYQFDTVTFDDTGATNQVITSGLLYPRSITNNGTTSYSLTGGGKISGAASIVKTGTGTLFVTNTGGNDFTGPITINSGVFRLGRTDSLGATNSGTTIASGAVLDLNAVSANNPGEFVTVSGTGTNNSGVIIESATNDLQNALRFVSLAGNSLITAKSPGRIDVRGNLGSGTFSGGLYLNGFTLTKGGIGKTEIADCLVTNGGNFVVSNGILAFTRSIVTGPGSVNIMGTNVMQFENNTTGTVTIPLIFTGGGATPPVLNAIGNDFVLGSVVSNLTGLTIDTSVALTLTNTLGGAGAVTKVSGGTLVLQQPDTCAGATLVSAGSLMLTNNGALPNTPSITLSSGTVLDDSAVGGFTISGTQTLSGNNATNVGSLTASGGANLIVGGGPGTLTVTADASLNGSTNFFELGPDGTQLGGENDLLSVGHNLSLSGLNTMNVLPLSRVDTNNAYTLISYANALAGGTLANLTAVSINPRYTFTIVNPLTTPNAVKLSVAGVAPTLLWRGTNTSTLWDIGASSNWFNGVNGDVFWPGDTVVFDDTAYTNLVTATGVMQPGSITFSNSSLPYTIAGPGGIKAGALFKAGNGTVTLAYAGTNAFAFGITNIAGTLAFNFATNATTISSRISDDGMGNGTLQQMGNTPATNTVTLSGNNTNFHGPTLISAGILRLGNANALGVTNSTVTITAGGTLDLNGQNQGLRNVVAVGAGASGLGAIYNSGGAQQNALRNVTITGDTTFGAANRWDMRSDGIGTAMLNTSPANSAYKLIKAGTNQFSLVGAVVDTGLGDVVVSNGILSLETSTFNLSHIVGDPAHTLTIGTNAQLQYFNLANPFDKPINMLVNSAITNNSGNTFLAAAINLSGSNNVINVGSGSVTINGTATITGNGVLVKNGGGSANNPLTILSANDPFTGTNNVIVRNGTLILGNNTAVGSTNNITVTTTSGGSGSSGTRITVSPGIVIPPGVSVNLPSYGNGTDPGGPSQGTNDLRSNLYFGPNPNMNDGEWQGPVYLGGPGTNQGYGSVNITADTSNGVFTIRGPIAGTLTNLILRGGNMGHGKIAGSIHATNNNGVTGPPRLEKTEACTWELLTNNNVWGDTIIHSGELTLGTNNALPTPTTTNGFLTLGENVAACLLDLGGFNQAVSGITAVAATNSDVIANSSSMFDSTLTILGTNITTFGGIIMDVVPPLTNYWLNVGGSNHVALTLAVGNTGSLSLANTNLYTGPTTINGGTLLVDGSLSNTVVTVNSGGSLGGIGQITGPVTVNSGGSVLGGDPPGTLTITTNLTLNGGATNQIYLGSDHTQLGGGNSLINVSSNLTLNSVSSFRLTPLGLLDFTGPYTVMTYGGTLSGGLANITAVSPRSYPLTVVDPASTPGMIQVNVASSPVTITWKGGAAGNPTVWDTAQTSNWLNGAVSDLFYSGDAVVFNDSGTTGSVTLTNLLLPISMTVSNNSLNYTFSGSRLNSGSLLKVGSGVAKLGFTNANLNGGATLVNGGTLLVNCLLSNTVVTVNSGGTLGGSGGTILGPVTVNSGGTLSAGASIGALTISNTVTLAAGSTNLSEFNMFPQANDLVKGITTLHYGGTLVVSNVGTVAISEGVALKLFDATNYTGGFAQIIPAAPGPGLFWDTSSLSVNGTLKVGAFLQFRRVSPLPDGNFRITVSGPIGNAYSLRATNDITVPTALWTLLNSGTITTSPFTVDDLKGTNYSQRFYQLSTP